MPSDIRSILSLEVPIIVLLGQRMMKTSEVVSLIPGSIVELPKKFDEELSLLVNNRTVGSGVAVKVGENFGLKVTYMGDLHERIAALSEKPEANAKSDDEVAALAEAMLAGQM